MGLRVLLVFGNYEENCHEHLYVYTGACECAYHCWVCTWAWPLVSHGVCLSAALLDNVTCSRVDISSYIVTSSGWNSSLLHMPTNNRYFYDKIFVTQSDNCNLVFHLGVNLFLPDHQWGLLQFWVFFCINSVSLKSQFACCFTLKMDLFSSNQKNCNSGCACYDKPQTNQRRIKDETNKDGEAAIIEKRGSREGLL